MNRVEQDVDASAMGRPLVQLLEELAALLSRLDDAVYARSPVGVMPGSVGAHVRHCLDHVAALVACVESGRLDYDDRRRGTPVETSVDAAREAIGSLIERVSALPVDAPARPVRLAVMMTCDGPTVEVASSVGREFAYVLSHTIHHNAIIGAMVKTLGGVTPERFGYAPATLRQMDLDAASTASSAACAR